MSFTTLKIAGSEALDSLNSRRASFPSTGEYVFLIGGVEELGRINEAAEFNDQTIDAIIQAAINVDLEKWIAKRRTEAEEYEFSLEETLGV